MCLIVGHADAGYPPDEPEIEVNDLDTAVRVLINLVTKWFSIELIATDGDEPELTPVELRRLVVKASQIKGPGSTVILRGHAFWIH